MCMTVVVNILPLSHFHCLNMCERDDLSHRNGAIITWNKTIIVTIITNVAIFKGFVTNVVLSQQYYLRF